MENGALDRQTTKSETPNRDPEKKNRNIRLSENYQHESRKETYYRETDIGNGCLIESNQTRIQQFRISSP